MNWYQFLILLISSIFFSYAGSKFSLLSIKYAPNPGYSLVISKSYVVFTTVFALVFFHAALSVTSATAIGLIIIFSAFIFIDPKTKQSHATKPIWLPLTIATFFCWGMLAISSKYLLDLGVSVYTRLIYVMAIVSAMIAVDIKKEKITLQSLSIEHRWLFFIIGLLFAGFNYFMQLGYQLAPNIGFINAMNAASVAVVAVGAVIFFHDDFSPRKFIGVIGVIAGLILLVI